MWWKGIQSSIFVGALFAAQKEKELSLYVYRNCGRDGDGLFGCKRKSVSAPYY